MGRAANKSHVRRGDVVEVLSGNARGKSGKVLSVDVPRRRAIVEGLNLVKKHIRKNQDYPQGGIIEKESPIHVSNLKVTEAAARD